ncbi:hypothetical protein HJC23_004642 [Cyclotella cryptica]|uniref:Uncharacterized protein n=1 Tax=Cyclotella cryptica TaxID=29204 RepID=A0ABD3QGG5_9STRA
MIRDPTNLRASTHAMAMCALNGKVNTFNYWRMKHNETSVCTKEEGLDLERLVQDYHARVWNKCRLAMGHPPSVVGNVTTHKKRLDKYERRICTHGPQSMSHCLSPSHLLSSPAYGGMRSMYKSFLGRYFADQVMGDTNSYVSVERVLRRRYGGGGSGNSGEGMGGGMQRIEEYALVDLGGLDVVQYHPYDMEGFLSKLQAVRSPLDKLSTTTTTTATHPIEEFSTYDEPDILWFGITERMMESTCLLFYVLRVPPISVPKSRVVNCSPASWWSAKDREEVKRREEGDYALWRVANAILDVRVEKMRREIRERLRSGECGGVEREWLESLVEAGCLESSIFLETGDAG